MKLVIATRRLATPGGSETFVLTLGEALAQLGHDVLLLADEVGSMAEEASRRALTVEQDPQRLPVDVDATIALDRELATGLAIRFPQAVRLYAMHNALEEWLPPPHSGIVAATLAPNARFAMLARGVAGAGRVIRMRQPIDLARFSPRGWADQTPRAVLTIGNYSWAEGQRITQLEEAWREHRLEWRQLGHPAPTLDTASAIAQADIVVGYGRSILEAMSCGRPAYVHEHSGSDGWVTAESYARLEADGFAGTAGRVHPGVATLQADFAHYRPELGRVGQDLVRLHHDARMVAAGLLSEIAGMTPPERATDTSALLDLKRSFDSHRRAEQKAEGYRAEAKAATAQLRAATAQLEQAGESLRRAELDAQHWRDKATEATVALEAVRMHENPMSRFRRLTRALLSRLGR